MTRLLLCAALAVGACSTSAPTLAPFPEAAAAKTAPDLVALYEAYRAGDVSASPVYQVIDGTVLIEATATDGDGEGLAEALGRVGLTDASSYGPVVNGRLPIDSLPTAAALDELRYLRSVVRPDRTPPTPPQRL